LSLKLDVDKVEDVDRVEDLKDDRSTVDFEQKSHSDSMFII